MPYTFGQLKTDVRLQAFPDGEAKNLVTPHNKILVEFMVELQQWCQRHKINNTEIIPFCAILFQCGMSVFQAPRGVINRVSTFARLDADCNEDAAADVSWCSEVKYKRVEYDTLTKILDQTLKCSCSGLGLADLCSMDYLACRKYLGKAFPAPDDAGYSGMPELPLGFHYSQDSTDMTYRATSAVWALKNNRIYLAPWINSSEVVVVEWDGMKRVWTDADIVDTDEDALVVKAAKHYLLMCHYRDYERDDQMYAHHKNAYSGNSALGIIGALPALIHQSDIEADALADRDTVSKAVMSGKTLQEQSIGIIP